MKKYIGKKWSQLTIEQQEELRSEIIGCIDASTGEEVEEGWCIVDFKSGLSIGGTVICHNKDEGDYEVIIDDDSILYDAEGGCIVENEKFKGLISLKDAGIMFNKEESTLRHAIKRGKFIEWVDCIKFGTTWVFDITALEREYGKRD